MNPICHISPSSSESTILPNDFISSYCHSSNVGVLKSCYPSIRREGVEECNLEENLEVGNQCLQVIQELSRKFVSHGAGITELAGLLTWCLAKVSQQGVPGFGVR